MKKVFEKIMEKQEELFQDLNVIEVLSHVDFDSTIQNSLENFLKAITNEAIEIVKQEAEKYNNVWISCSERLPEEHKQYDITTKNEVGIHSDTAIYNPFLGMWFWDEAESEHIEIEVLAWAEKREPYQTKGE